MTTMMMTTMTMTKPSRHGWGHPRLPRAKPPAMMIAAAAAAAAACAADQAGYDFFFSQ
jgi:hypothetical protein